jgi:hypothetical protein
MTKPLFLVKMCAEFEEAETLFRLPSAEHSRSQPGSGCRPVCWTRLFGGCKA